MFGLKLCSSEADADVEVTKKESRVYTRSRKMSCGIVGLFESTLLLWKATSFSD